MNLTSGGAQQTLGWAHIYTKSDTLSHSPTHPQESCHVASTTGTAPLWSRNRHDGAPSPRPITTRPAPTGTALISSVSDSTLPFVPRLTPPHPQSPRRNRIF